MVAWVRRAGRKRVRASQLIACWIVSLGGIAGSNGQDSAAHVPAARPGRPDIVIVLADDMGFSDAGCYGSEIATPNLDRLAAGGLRFTQFYNAARCCPTRASLLTGLYPHQSGIGHMTADHGLPGYRSAMNDRCVTVAEVLRQGGYRTFMSGKWHLGMQRQEWPIEHGFDHYFGQLSGACNYFRPEPRRVMALDREVFTPPIDGFYLTDAITDHAVRFLGEAGEDASRPFFLYVAYTAPHAPLHALAEDIAKYRGKYRDGWDAIRRRRYERMREMGIIQPAWPLSPRDPQVPSWESILDKDEQDLRMAVYAAQVDRMDQGIGRIVEQLRKTGRAENTLLLFLSDNGGDAEDIDEGQPGAAVGTAESYRGYAPPWANVSNTPFRRFKRQVHEGGIATPLIAYWPAAIRQGGRITHEVGHVMDLMATCYEAAGVSYPAEWQGRPIIPTQGKSLMPLFADRPREQHECLFWEHEGNRAVRCGHWKLVAIHGADWELYDMDADRTELNDLADDHADVVTRLSAKYDAWARDCGVVPWDDLPEKVAGHK